VPPGPAAGKLLDSVWGLASAPPFQRVSHTASSLLARHTGNVQIHAGGMQISYALLSERGEALRGYAAVAHGPPNGPQRTNAASGARTVSGSRANKKPVSAANVTPAPVSRAWTNGRPATVAATRPCSAPGGAEAVGRTERYWPGAPDFAAEVVSPADTFAEVEAKALDWLAGGTKVVLVIDPARRTATSYRGQADVQVHTGDAKLDLDDAVPGWRVALSDFFG
jgi:Putative restriction endonuclease